jgi:uncharacterized LabA/DUF88 family protein
MSAHILESVLFENDRTAVFIDGANLYSTSRALQFDVDYRKLLSEFRRRTRLIRAYYYTALLEEQDFSPIRPLVDWLDYNGYTLVTKAAREYTDQMGKRRVKGDMDVEITVDMLEIAPHADHLVLFSGDGDFTALIAAIQRRGVRTTVVSTMRSNPPMVSDELRRQADTFLELMDLSSIMGRPPRPQSTIAGRYGDDEDGDI